MIFKRALRKSLVLLVLASPFLTGCSSKVEPVEPGQSAYVQVEVGELERLKLAAEEIKALEARVKLYKKRDERKETDYMELQKECDRIDKIMKAQSLRLTTGSGMYATQSNKLADSTKAGIKKDFVIKVYENVLQRLGYERPEELLETPDLKPTALDSLRVHHNRQEAEWKRWNDELLLENNKLRNVETRARYYIKSIGGDIRVLYDSIVPTRNSVQNTGQ